MWNRRLGRTADHRVALLKNMATDLILKGKIETTEMKAKELRSVVDHLITTATFRLAELLPKDKLKVSESGISNPDTIRQLRQAGFQGFLIGETFMKETDPGLALKNFIEAL